MTVVAWPRMRAQVFAVAIACVLVGPVGSLEVSAQPQQQRRGDPESRPPVATRRGSPAAQRQRAAGAASAPILRTNTLLDLDTQQRDGHLTPEERRLLRQHIEDAVRELYKR